MLKLDWFPNHKCELILRHNTNTGNYETVKELIIHTDYDWQSEEHKQRAVDTNEIWELQWYPETPIGFYLIAAPTLNELIEFAQGFKEESK